MVVDLVDKTGAKTQAIIGNMSRLQRAERDFMLADRGGRLSRRDKGLENLMMQKQMDVEERQQRFNMWLSRGAVATAAVGLAAGKAYTDFASLERRVNRIVINADKGANAIRPTISTLQKVASDTRIGLDSVVEGLEALVASGRTLDESLAFLPSVAITSQASGAAMGDVARTADAMAGSLKVSAKDMQKAFDILVVGSKNGKFELNDMAQYLPSLAPAFAALGYEGTEGVQKLVAVLQILRNQAGSSGEAATYASNLFNKMASPEIQGKFKKLGINLSESLAEARRNGRDVLDVFLQLVATATKGDISKLGDIFTDVDMQKGVRALVTQRPELEAMFTSMNNVDGSALKDFNQIAEDSASKIQRLNNLWDKFSTQVGAGVATVVNPTLQGVTDQIDHATAVSAANAGMDQAQRNEQMREYGRRWDAANPDAGLLAYFKGNQAYSDSLARVGRGEIKSVFEDLDEIERRKAAIDTYLFGRAKPSTGRQNRSSLGISTGAIPLPRSNPRKGGDRQALIEAYMYGDGRPNGNEADAAGAEASRMSRKSKRERLRRASLSQLGMEGMPGAELEDAKVKAAGPAAVQGLVDAIRGGLTDAMRGFLSSEATKEVSISGTPTVISQPSGVQQVTVTNPMPAPVVNVSVVVHAATSASPAEIGKMAAAAIGEKVKAALSGVHADVEYAVG